MGSEIIRYYLLILAMIVAFLVVSGCEAPLPPATQVSEKPTPFPTAKPTQTDVFATPAPSTTAAYSPCGTWRTGQACGIPSYNTNLQSAKVYNPESGLPPNANEYNGHWMIFIPTGQFRIVDIYSTEGSDIMQDVKGSYVIKGGSITLSNQSVMSMSNGQWRSRGTIPDKQYTLAFTNEDTMLFDGSTYVKVAS